MHGFGVTLCLGVILGDLLCVSFGDLFRGFLCLLIVLDVFVYMYRSASFHYNISFNKDTIFQVKRIISLETLRRLSINV